MTDTQFDVVESATLTLDAENATGARWNALLIKKGWGAKGYYTEEALRNDGPNVFKAGTPIFVDHLTPSDREFYNFGKVGNLVGELATDAAWDDVQQGLTAEVEVYEHRRAEVKAIAKKVGLSIRAITKGGNGEAEGRRGKIFTGLVGAKSVDLVVRAGAGGQLLDVLESAVDIEMDDIQMNDELKTYLDGFGEKLDKFGERLTSVEESLTAEAQVEEKTEAKDEVVADKIEEKTETVVEPVTAETIAELVAAEVAKIQAANVEESATEKAGYEESTVEESAVTEIKLPTRWAVKGAK